MNEPNYSGDVRWYVVTAADQVTVPDFSFEQSSAPYFMGQLTDGRIVVFDRAAMLEMIDLWQKADNEMRATP